MKRYGIHDLAEPLAALVCYLLVAFGFCMVMFREQFAGFVIGLLP